MKQVGEIIARLTRPIIGIENRTAQEVFDIMRDRFAALKAGDYAVVPPALVAAGREQIKELLADAHGRRLLAEDWNTPEDLEDGLIETARIEEDTADLIANMLGEKE